MYRSFGGDCDDVEAMLSIGEQRQRTLEVIDAFAGWMPKRRVYDTSRAHRN